MSKSSQKARREKQRARRREGKLDKRDICGVIDKTPYLAVNRIIYKTK